MQTTQFSTETLHKEKLYGFVAVGEIKADKKKSPTITTTIVTGDVVDVDGVIISI